MRFRKKGKPELAKVVYRNIEASGQMRDRFERKKKWHDRCVDGITRFVGTVRFVYLHLLLLSLWIVINLGFLSIIKPFDPYPFPILGIVASVETIFLSAFVLISQTRLSQLQAQRDELELQVNLLSEHEVTHLLNAVERIAMHLGLPREQNVDDLKKHITPEHILEAVEDAEGQRSISKGQ
ncbi:MAG: DUF1003 domain-containing protein [Bdellovibrionia bacterium]